MKIFTDGDIALGMCVAHRLQEARESKGWTQQELARRTGIKQSLVSRYEAGKHIPGFLHMITLAKTLKRSLVWFTK